MTVRWVEVPEYAEGSDNPPSRVYAYKFFGSISEDVVRRHAMNATPRQTSTVNGILYREGITTSQIGYDSFLVRVTYSTRKNTTGEWTWDFDTTGGSLRAYVSKETVRARGYQQYEDLILTPGWVPPEIGNPVNYPDHNGAIDVQGDEVKGVEIVVPSMKVGVSFRHPLGVMTLDYARYIEQLTGVVNNKSMLGWAPGEVLFLGARGRDGTEAECVVDYFFAMSRNTSTLTMGTISNIVKEGWNVIWTTFDEDDDPIVTLPDGEKYPTKQPKFIHIERVYDTVNLAAALGFGA